MAMAVPGFIVIVCLAYDSRGYGNYTYMDYDPRVPLRHVRRDVLTHCRAVVAALVVAFVPAAHAAEPCAVLTGFKMPGHEVVIREAREITASAPGVTPAVPAHCRVDGVVDSRVGRDGKPFGIGFAVALPANWNGHFLFQGGGGLNGSV